MVMSNVQRITPGCSIESFYTTGTQRRVDCSNADGFCGHCNTMIEAKGCFYHYCPCQDARRALSEKDIHRGTKKEEMDEMEN